MASRIVSKIYNYTPSKRDAALGGTVVLSAFLGPKYFLFAAAHYFYLTRRGNPPAPRTYTVLSPVPTRSLESTAVEFAEGKPENPKPTSSSKPTSEPAVQPREPDSLEPTSSTESISEPALQLTGAESVTLEPVVLPVLAEPVASAPEPVSTSELAERSATPPISIEPEEVAPRSVTPELAVQPAVAESVAREPESPKLNISDEPTSAAAVQLTGTESAEGEPENPRPTSSTEPTSELAVQPTVAESVAEEPVVHPAESEKEGAITQEPDQPAVGPAEEGSPISMSTSSAEPTSEPVVHPAESEKEGAITQEPDQPAVGPAEEGSPISMSTSSAESTSEPVVHPAESQIVETKPEEKETPQSFALPASTSELPPVQLLSPIIPKPDPIPVKDALTQASLEVIKPISGKTMSNGGNTCYLSSILWAFVFHDPFIEKELRKAFQKATDDFKETKIAKEKWDVLHGLVILLDKYKRGECATDKMMDAFRNRLLGFAPYLVSKDDPLRGQKDANLALILILELILEHSEKKSTFQEVFGFSPVYRDTELAPGDYGRPIAGDAWRLVIDPHVIEKKPRLEIALSESIFHETQAPHKDSTYNCPVVGRKELVPFYIVKRTRKWREEPFPFLMVHLRRFTNDGKKISAKVQIPERVRFPSHCNEKGYEATYRLQGVVQHHGPTLKGGHYTAGIKKENQYYQCDDSVKQSEKYSDLKTILDHGDVYLLKYVLEK